MNGKRFSEDKARKNGFYLALAVCLVAVGIAAWSTYDAVHSYTSSEGTAQSALNQLKNQEVRSGQEVSQPAPSAAPSAAPKDTDPEKPASSSSPARQTAGSVILKTETSSAPEAPVSSAPEEEPQVPVNAPLYELSSEMVWPLKSEEVLKAYSSGAPVYSETMKDWRVHTGTDVKASAGDEVRACANGQVKGTYTDAMLGNVILVEHGDYLFSYCGVGEDFQVKEGDIVTKGQVIGKVTAVPCEAADEPHLHVEVRRDSAWLDPQSVIDGKN